MTQRKALKMDVQTCEHPTLPHEKFLSLDLGMRERCQLCTSCSSIDFKRAFAFTRNQVGGDGIAFTETRTDIQSGCDLCSLVASMISLKVNPTFGTTVEEYHLRALDSLWALRQRRTDACVATNPSIVVAVVQGRSSVQGRPRRTFARHKMIEANIRGFIVPLVQDSSWEILEICPIFYRARTVSCSVVDFARIGSWLKECQESESTFHHRCKSQPRRTTFSSRVIDCETRELVPMTPDLEYLALSYVWGKSSNNTDVDETVQSGFRLPNPAPQTIEDAITVVRRLQKRYLWVDRYCIWQSEDKHLQIQNMDQIYRNALTTIVAADGDNPESGLRGVSCPRQQQSSFKTNAGTVAYTFPHVSYHLSMSIWATRGWTYQEAVLSRSCLFFTKNQVYFACKTHLRSEAVEQKQIFHHDRTQEALAPRLMRLSEQFNYPMSQEGLSSFYDHVKEYTSRSLSWDTDALNAFKGIIASLDEYTYWGIPFTSVSPRSDGWYSPGHEEAVFAQNLAWIGKRLPPGGVAIRRRKDFPTWSWTSLVDQIQIQETRKFFIERPSVGCCAFYVTDDKQNRLRIADVFRDAQTRGTRRITDVFRNAQKRGTLIIPEHGRALLVKALVTQVCLRSTDEEGLYSIHIPVTSKRDPNSNCSGLKLKEEALVDCPDADLLSRIESQPWSAIKLFWFTENCEGVRVLHTYWMLVDRCDPVARRIGLIRPSAKFFETKITMELLKAKKMEHLKAKTRWIRIE